MGGKKGSWRRDQKKKDSPTTDNVFMNLGGEIKACDPDSAISRKIDSSFTRELLNSRSAASGERLNKPPLRQRKKVMNRERKK